MKSPLAREVTPEENRQFLRDGMICLRNIMTPEWVEITRQGVEAQRENPSEYATIVDTDNLYLLVDQMPSAKNEMLKRVIFESGIAEIAKELGGTAKMCYLFDQMFYKGAGPVAETPWHQDTPYGFFDGPGIIRAWIPVDPIPRQTTLEAVRGSHLWNVEYATIESVAVLEDNVGKTTTAKYNYLEHKHKIGPKLPEIEKHRDAFDIVGYEVNPGDVVFFSYHILHRAGGGMNPNNKRRAYAVVYATEDTVLRKRPTAVPGPLEAAGCAWETGQHISEFPQVFPSV